MTEDFAALGDAVIQRVQEHFFNETVARRWAAAHAGYGKQATGRADFTARTRAALARLKTSHTGYYTPDDPEYYGLLAIFRAALPGVGEVRVESAGADFTSEGFVRVLFAGGPAEK